jgi:diguanylate cyclase (GGDEF)-like protein
MGRTRPPYSPEFRQEAVRLLRNGVRSPRDLAELGCSEQTLRSWRNQNAVDRGERPEALSMEERARLRELERENRALRERSDLLARLDAQARTDELTSVPNRRPWDQAISRALAEVAPVCVAILDIDHFKPYNDKHGHVAGDNLLQQCSAAWTRQLRPEDVRARYGGEEFAVLLHDWTLQGATAVLERVRNVTPAGATCSIGVAERRDSDTETAVLARADTALYQAKRDGTNRLKAA